MFSTPFSSCDAVYVKPARWQKNLASGNKDIDYHSRIAFIAALLLSPRRERRFAVFVVDHV